MEWYDRIIVYGLLIYISFHSGFMVLALNRILDLWKKIIVSIESK